jgi:RNA polymerase sigma-70 factor, ECF subfamily
MLAMRDQSELGISSMAQSARNGIEAESSLIDEVIAGHRGAARAIYEAHVVAVHRLSARIVGPHMADECTQEAFVRAFQRLPTFRREAALATWLHAITVSVALNLKRRDKRCAAYVALDFAENVACYTPDSDPILSNRITRAIDLLDDDLRAVIILRLIEGRTHADVGLILGIPESTSKTRCARARAQLREALADVAPAGCWLLSTS